MLDNKVFSELLFVVEECLNTAEIYNKYTVYLSQDQLRELIEFYVGSGNSTLLPTLNSQACILMERQGTFQIQSEFAKDEDLVELFQLLSLLQTERESSLFHVEAIKVISKIRDATTQFLEWGIYTSVSKENTKRTLDYREFLESELRKLGVGEKSVTE